MRILEEMLATGEMKKETCTVEELVNRAQDELDNVCKGYNISYLTMNIQRVLSLLRRVKIEPK